VFTHPLRTHRPLALLALLLVAAPSSAWPNGPAEPRRVEDAFLSGGKRVAVERYEPAAEGRFPVVVLLHAIDGLDAAHAPLYRAAARRYAGRGYVVLLVHYFDRTGDSPERVKAAGERFYRYANGKCGADEEKAVGADFRAWMDTVADAVTFGRGLGSADGERVGLVGFSLGAYLALATAADRDLKLAAVVDLFGGLPKPMRGGAKNLPPTLILHGDADPVVPVTEAYSLRNLLRKAKRPCELKVYAEAGHVFAEPPDEDGPGTGPLTWEALVRIKKQTDDADERTAAFLEKYLKRGGR
jgi:carboxymethylenebutenolidase